MMRAAVALLVSVAVMSAGCFPHNAARRQQAKYAEGGALVAGILVSALSNTGADCDSMAMQGIDPTSCRTKARVLGTVGLALILAGLLGFVATVSTAEDDNDAKPVTTVVPDTTKAGATAGSAATPPPTTAPTTPPPPTTTPPTTSTEAAGETGSGAGSATTPPTP
jgi:hypothetical protein